MHVLEAPKLDVQKQMEEVLNVVVTTYDGEFVGQVAGDNVNLTILMPPEADPHTYESGMQD